MSNFHFENELPEGIYDGKAENYPAMLRSLENSLMAYRVPTERPIFRPPQFYSILLAQNLPVDPSLLSREDHKELVIFEKELHKVAAYGNQAILCLMNLLSKDVRNLVRHIREDPSLKGDPWVKYERSLVFLAADIAGDTENTIRRLQLKMDQLQPVTKRELLWPA